MTDLEMLQDTTNWPRMGEYTYCCVKKYDKTTPGKFPPLENFGRLVAHNGFILALDEEHPGIAILRDRPYLPLAYASIEAMLADGWVVD